MNSPDLSRRAATALDRRRFIGAGLASGAMLALPACASYGGFSYLEAIRRLLLISSENAFARLTEPNGFWDEQVAQLGLGDMIGTRGDVLSRILTSTLVKDRLEDTFADFAIDASFRAAPIVADAVDVIGFANAVDLVRGGPRAATTALRGEIGGRLIDAMVPELGDAIRIASDPLIADLLNAATGTDVGRIAQSLAGNIDETIWDEIGREEAIIRANPDATNDPVLVEAFGRWGGA
ncbi:DUF4197 domain-containing protein [Erythrobacter sp.]|uniref:DUF4197 domain-containing protein n=1 Tax=Erythrobacter sp. TaxID=1042 RepID=UPI002EC03B53|nr:DUF4197 domain-containing protein [Erythrobacter sp.]